MVLQVGIGFWYTGRYFLKWVFVVGFSKYRDIGSVFSVFHFASKHHVRILKFCFKVNPRILTEDPCPRSGRWQKLAICCPHKRRLTGGGG